MGDDEPYGEFLASLWRHPHFFQAVDPLDILWLAAKPKQEDKLRDELSMATDWWG